MPLVAAAGEWEAVGEMNKPKRHHYVPSMLSRRFANQDGRLYFFDKRIPDRGVQLSTPRNLFVKSHLYTYMHKNGTKDVGVETSLSNLEGQANSIINKIVDAARERKTPNLTQAEKKTWSKYSYIQWNRVPDVRKRIGADEVPEEWIPQMLRDLGGMEEVNRIRNNAWVESILDPGISILTILMKKGLGIVLAQDLGVCFVIGSNPTIKLTHPCRASLTDPSVEFWFPLACDVAVTPIADELEKLVEVDAKAVRYINKCNWEQSSAIAGCSYEIIASLSGGSKQS